MTKNLIQKNPVQRQNISVTDICMSCRRTKPSARAEWKPALTLSPSVLQGGQGRKAVLLYKYFSWHEVFLGH